MKVHRNSSIDRLMSRRAEKMARSERAKNYLKNTKTSKSDFSRFVSASGVRIELPDTLNTLKETLSQMQDKNSVVVEAETKTKPTSNSDTLTTSTNSLIKKKKGYVTSQSQNYKAKEFEEFKMAYEAYHTENGKQLIDKMSGDMKKAYGIYKSIIDGENTSLDDQEFLRQYNDTMYRGAKAEYVRITDDMYKYDKP